MNVGITDHFDQDTKEGYGQVAMVLWGDVQGRHQDRKKVLADERMYAELRDLGKRLNSETLGRG